IERGTQLKWALYQPSRIAGRCYRVSHEKPGRKFPVFVFFVRTNPIASDEVFGTWGAFLASHGLLKCFRSPLRNYDLVTLEPCLAADASDSGGRDAFDSRDCLNQFSRGGTLPLPP